MAGAIHGPMADPDDRLRGAGVHSAGRKQRPGQETLADGLISPFSDGRARWQRPSVTIMPPYQTNLKLDACRLAGLTFVSVTESELSRCSTALPPDVVSAA